jgi:hypothetical protein
VFGERNRSGSKGLSTSTRSVAKFKILCFGELMEVRRGDVCFGLIGHGPTIFIRKSCRINHNGKKVELNLSTICVIKSNDVCLFSEPTFLLEQVDYGLFQKWKDDRMTLDEWTERFGIARSSKDVLTDKDLKASTGLIERAKNFKAPLKSMMTSSDEEIEEMLSMLPPKELYKRVINTPSDLDKLRDITSSFFTRVIQGQSKYQQGLSWNSLFYSQRPLA